jgi:hypothetical protein
MIHKMTLIFLHIYAKESSKIVQVQGWKGEYTPAL